MSRPLRCLLSLVFFPVSVSFAGMPPQLLPPQLLDPLGLIAEPMQVATKLFGAFFPDPVRNPVSNSTNFHKPSKRVKKGRRTKTNSTAREPRKKQVPEAVSTPITSLIPLLPRPTGVDLDVADTVLTMITSTAALPAFVNFANIAASQMAPPQTSLFSDTPFGSADAPSPSQPSLRSRGGKTRKPHPPTNPQVPSSPQPGSIPGNQGTELSAGPIAGAIIPFLPDSMHFVSDNHDSVPPDPQLTPYSNALARKKPSVPGMKSLLYRSTLPLNQAGAWKALNLFGVGVSNSFGHVPSSPMNDMTQEFVSSLISDRYPYSPIVFATLVLDTLSFVNTTQHLHCPPREAYNAESLGKMLFLRSSNIPEAYATVSVDYFRVASTYFADPSFKSRHHVTNSHSSQSDEAEFDLPMSRFPAPSLGSIAQSASSLATLFHQSQIPESQFAESHANSQVALMGSEDGAQFEVSASAAEAIQIIEHYNSISGAHVFLDLPFKDGSNSLDLLSKAAEVSLGPIGQGLVQDGSELIEQGIDTAFNPFKKVIEFSVPLPPVANIRSTRNNKKAAHPLMSKSKRLKLEDMGAFTPPDHKLSLSLK